MTSTTAVRHDLYPAELVADPDAPDPQDRRRVYPVRVIVTMDEILVFAEEGRRPNLVFRDRLASYSPALPAARVSKAERRSGAHQWAVATTDSGHALTWKRSAGCGCGSRLKTMSLSLLLSAADSRADSQTGAPDDVSTTALLASSRDA